MASGTIKKIGAGAWSGVALPYTLQQDSVVRISLSPYNSNAAYILISDGTTTGLRLNAFSGFAEIQDFVCKKGATLSVTAISNADASVLILPLFV